MKARDITDLVNKRLALVLDVAAAAIPPDRFPAFRKIVLRQFGADELAADIERLLAESAVGQERQGQGGN